MDDIQSWWEVPSIAHFCSLFRVAFNLLDFDIEELEEALLTDGAELSGSSLLQELIVRLLCGCLGNNGISVFNYQMFLRRLFRTKCRELDRENPFDTDIDFQFLPLRTKVEILHALCDFRLDADDVIDVLKNLDSDSLRVHPLGHDENKSAYWYFYGTRLYREDFPKKRKKKRDHDKQRSKKKRREEESTSSSEDDEPRVGAWQVLCYTESDWQKLAESLADSDCKEEQALYAVLTEDFLPEIPRLFEEKERLQRKRLLENQPRRTSSRLEKLKSQRLSQKELARMREEKYMERERSKRDRDLQKKRRALRALARSRSKSESDSSICDSINHYTGRQTNNSLSSATGKIIIQPTRQKFRASQLFRRTREDLMTGLYKVLDRLKTHEDAWPFIDPVEEEYAPKYYSVIAKPMDLQAMEDKLDNGEYGSLQEFKSDFQLIVDNCRQYNGSDNEYTQMVSRLQDAFRGLVDRYLEVEQSSDDEIIPFIHREDTMGGNDLSSPERNHSRTTFTESNSEVESDRKSPLMKPLSKSEVNKENEEEDEENEGRESHKRRFRKKTRKKRSKRGEEGRSSSPEDHGKSREASRERVRVDYRERETSESDVFSDQSRERDEESVREEKLKSKKPLRKTVKRTGVIRNAAAIEALELATEQTLKDINKWLDDTPRFSDFSSNSNSPLHITCTEEMASIEGEYRRRLQMDRPMRPRDRFSNDLHRRRMFKEQMGLKRRREVQRTIDRLQPGKSKGNLLSKENQQDNLGTETKFSSIDSDDNTPKLSLGKVLANDLIGFGICDTPRKDSDDECTQERPYIEINPEPKAEKHKEEEEIRKEPILIDKDQIEGEKVEPKKEKPTPNLSAWFKAFGAPKPQNNQKKKVDEAESIKPIKEDEISLEEDRERRACVIQSPARRQRKTSTGSSVSERSSFSQEPLDGNSPRQSIDEPYLSPQPEVKTYYHSPINGTIKVGFYQDTCFPRGTSEKSGSPRDIHSCSPRDIPNCSPRTPYCSPRNPPSPREYPSSPRSYPIMRSPSELCPRDYPPNRSPREAPPMSPKELIRSPKHDYPTYTSASNYQAQNTRMYSSVPHYPSHIQYFDTSRPITDQYRNSEKSSVPIYPVKKRAYNDIEATQQPKSPEPVSPPPFKGGSFTPTKGAMEQERTFTPTPGRIPTQSIRVSDSTIPMGLPHHPLQHHIMETYAEERHLSSPFYTSDGIYSKSQGAAPAHSMFVGSQPSVISSNFNRDPNIERQPCEPTSPPPYANRVLSPYHAKSRNENLNYPSSPPMEPIKSKTPITYQTRSDDSPDNSSASPLNYSNVGNNSHKETPATAAFINRQSDVSKPSSPINYNKVTNQELLSGAKVSTPFSYSSNTIEDMFPSKVSSPYNRGISQLPPGINYPPNADLSKMGVPPLSYGNQPELLAAKMNYNHPMADLMQTSSRYNYPMQELMQGKSGVYNQAVQELIQSKAAYNNMVQGFNRPIADMIQNKVSELQSETAFSRAGSQPLKPELSAKPKKGRKKKNELPAPSGFQQYVAPTSEAIALKTASGVSGSAFNFGPPLKDSYSSYLEDMRSSYFAPHTEGAPAKGTPSPSYFLGHASTRPPTYPHPFMNSQYQHFLQRHSEELLRPMMIHQGLLPPPAGYPAGYLGMHDAINRPSWL